MTDVREKNPNPKEYMYSIAVQWAPQPGAMGYKQLSGTYVSVHRATRFEAFNEILTACAAQVGQPAEKMVVVFFTLELNDQL